MSPLHPSRLRYIFSVILLMALIGTVERTQAQYIKVGKALEEAEKYDSIKERLEKQTFTFHPVSGSLRNSRFVAVGAGYEISIDSGEIVSGLPYSITTLTGNEDVSRGGMTFTSSKYEYQVKKVKKGWLVIVRPGDTGQVLRLVYNIFKDGKAILNVTMLSLPAITYNGYID